MTSIPPSPDNPVVFEIAYPERLSRWLPFVKWLLALPHFFALFFVLIAAGFVGVFGLLAVLVLGRWPRWAFDYVVGSFRWMYRVIAYLHLMVDRYPPFSLADDPAYPVRFRVAYPERTGRWRPLVHWLLVTPYVYAASLLLMLTALLAFMAFFCILFTRRIPRDLFAAMVPGLRCNVIGAAYQYTLTSRYPRFGIA